MFEERSQVHDGVVGIFLHRGHFGEWRDQAAATGEAGDLLLYIGAGVDIVEADEVVRLEGAAAGEVITDAALAEGYAESSGGGELGVESIELGGFPALPFVPLLEAAPTTLSQEVSG